MDDLELSNASNNMNDTASVGKQLMSAENLEALTARFYDSVATTDRLSLKKAFATCDNNSFDDLYNLKVKSKYVALCLTFYFGCGAQWIYLRKGKSIALFFGLLGAGIVLGLITLVCWLLGSFVLGYLPFVLSICSVGAIYVWSLVEFFCSFKNVYEFNYNLLIDACKKR